MDKNEKTGLVIIAPIPVEYAQAKAALQLTERPAISGCRASEGERGGLKIVCLQSGPGKARSAQAVTAAIQILTPGLIVDTGTCAGLNPAAAIGDIILSWRCFEFDLSGQGIPDKRIREMELESGIRYLPTSAREALVCRAGVCGQKLSLRVLEGTQAAGEYLINDETTRNRLVSLFEAAGGNWETAAVFLSALRASLPAVSLRAVSDRGDRNALADFRAHVRPVSQALYRYVGALIDDGWFRMILSEWAQVKESVWKNLPRSVLP